MKPENTVLIVDDERSVRETLDALLSLEPYHLAFASGGEDALVIARDILPDVVLLDVMMPGMSGYEVCAALRADPLLAEVPILMITALDDRESRLRGIEAGADDFIAKPFDHIELRSRIRTILRLNRYRLLLSGRNRLEWIVDRSGDGHIVVNGGGIVSYMNAKARLLLGVREGNGIGEHFRTLAEKHYEFHPAHAWEQWPESPAPGEPLYLVIPEGDAVPACWLRTESAAIFPGKNQEYAILLRDVTDEVSLRREISAFHSMISHKLNTPMNHVLASLQFLADDAGEMPKEVVDRLFRIAVEGATQLNNIIKSIFSYSRHERDGADDDVFPLALMKDAVAEACRRGGIARISVRIPDDLAEMRIPIAAKDMEIVLQELFENARKFHPEKNPSVEVAVYADDSGMLHIEVTDDGVTLSPAQISRAKTPYYQAGKSLSGEMDGLGLGLSLVDTIIWNAGGTCRLHPREDCPGTIVELIFPVLAEEGCADARTA